MWLSWASSPGQSDPRVHACKWAPRLWSQEQGAGFSVDKAKAEKASVCGGCLGDGWGWASWSEMWRVAGAWRNQPQGDRGPHPPPHCCLFVEKEPEVLLVLTLLTGAIILYRAWGHCFWPVSDFGLRAAQGPTCGLLSVFPLDLQCRVSESISIC